MAVSLSGVLWTTDRVRALAGAAVLALAAAGGASAAPAGTPAAEPPVLPEEESDTAVLPAAGPHRLFLVDPYMAGGAHVVEGDDKELAERGLVPSAKSGAFSLSRDGGRVFVAETYWTHGDRGVREDLLTVYDGRTLALEKEVVLPSRFLVVPKVNQVATSADDALAYVYALAPASQVHVVDIAAGKVAGSIDIPGCALAYPFGPRSFATLCGDGTVGVATLDAAAKADPKFSKPFFDADADPIFENSIVDKATGEAWFLSFTGRIYPAKLAAAEPAVDKPWSIQAAAGLPAAGTGVQELAWRPGGGQLMALHRKSRRLFVLMHPGNYWTHKADGTEVWVLDADKHTLIRRITLPDPAKGVAVSQDDAPLLYVFGGRSGQLRVYDAQSGTPQAQRRLPGAVALAPGL